MLQFERFMKMQELHGGFAAYLLVKCESNRLTKDDVMLAQANATPSSTLEKVIAGNLEAEPDLTFLASEGMCAIVFDLDLEVTPYMEEMLSVWLAFTSNGS